MDSLRNALSTGNRSAIYQLITQNTHYSRLHDYPLVYMKSCGQRNLGVGIVEDEPEIFFKKYQETLNENISGRHPYLDVMCQTVNYLMLDRLSDISPHFLQIYNHTVINGVTTLYMEAADMNVSEFFRNIRKQLIQADPALQKIRSYYSLPISLRISEELKRLNGVAFKLGDYVDKSKNAVQTGDVKQLRKNLDRAKIVGQTARIQDKMVNKLLMQRAKEHGAPPVRDKTSIAKITNILSPLGLSIRLQILMSDYLLYRYYNVMYHDKKTDNYVMQISDWSQNRKSRIQFNNRYLDNITSLRYIIDGREINVPIAQPLSVLYQFIVKITDIESLTGGTYEYNPELQGPVQLSQNKDSWKLSARERPIDPWSMISKALSASSIYFHGDRGCLTSVHLSDEDEYLELQEFTEPDDVDFTNDPRIIHQELLRIMELFSKQIPIVPGDTLVINCP